MGLGILKGGGKTASPVKPPTGFCGQGIILPKGVRR